VTDRTVRAVDAWEVLDSRGDPTVRVRVETGSGAGVFTVPSGASTGTHEAVEVRDGGDRYGGRGVRGAVRVVRDDLAPAVVGRAVTRQRSIDEAMVDRDGTPDLSRLGANAVLGVSGAVAHAAADALGEPLYRYLAPGTPGRVPLPMVNVLSGGLHADGGMDVQDVLVVPAGADTYTEAVETAWEVRTAVGERIRERGGRLLVADEGGFAPPLSGVEEAFDLVTGGIRDAGHRPATDDVALAVDVAATHFHEDGRYAPASADGPLGTAAFVDLIAGWVEAYPIVSVEDPLAEDDWAGWRALADRVGVQVLGDDLLVTDRARLSRAVEADAADAVLVKPNQAGTLSRAVDVVEAAQEAGVAPVVSARSGETCDATTADLAVALDAGQIKIGSLARSERLAKYNRLLGIEHRADPGYAGPDALAL